MISGTPYLTRISHKNKLFFRNKTLSLNLQRVTKTLYPRERLLTDKSVAGKHSKHLNFKQKLNVMSSLVFESGTILSDKKRVTENSKPALPVLVIASPIGTWQSIFFVDRWPFLLTSRSFAKRNAAQEQAVPAIHTKKF